MRHATRRGLRPPASRSCVSSARSRAVRGWEALTARLALEWADVRRAFTAERFVSFVLTSALVAAAVVAMVIVVAGLALVFLAEWLAACWRRWRRRKPAAAPHAAVRGGEVPWTAHVNMSK
jgi:hypothetical protein